MHAAWLHAPLDVGLLGEVGTHDNGIAAGGLDLRSDILRCAC